MHAGIAVQRAMTRSSTPSTPMGRQRALQHFARQMAAIWPSCRTRRGVSWPGSSHGYHRCLVYLLMGPPRGCGYSRTLGNGQRMSTPDSLSICLVSTCVCLALSCSQKSVESQRRHGKDLQLLLLATCWGCNIGGSVSSAVILSV